MKGFFTNRIVVGCISLTIAAVLTFIVLPIVTKTNNTDVEIACVGVDIPKGTVLSESYIKTKIVKKDNITADLIVQPKDVIGKIAKQDLFVGDLINKKSLTTEQERVNNYLYDIPVGKVAISVPFSNFLSNKLLAGDIISIYVDGKIPKELQYLEIISLTTNVVDVEQEQIESKDAEKPVPTNMIFVVDKKQADVLVALGENKTPVLVCRNNPTYKESLLKKQNDNLK